MQFLNQELVLEMGGDPWQPRTDLEDSLRDAEAGSVHGLP